MQTEGKAPGDGAEAEPANRLRVIVADGDDFARRRIVLTLRAHRFTVVADTGDGIEALHLARWYQPDVLVTEIALPRLDGVELTRRLAPAVRTVVLTTAADDEVAERARRLGASSVLPKQIEAENLVRVLRPSD